MRPLLTRQKQPHLLYLTRPNNALLIVGFLTNNIIELNGNLLGLGERAKGDDLQTVTILNLQYFVVTFKGALNRGGVAANLSRELLTIGIDRSILKA